jgi:hypothetical protein
MTAATEGTQAEIHDLHHGCFSRGHPHAASTLMHVNSVHPMCTSNPPVWECAVFQAVQAQLG